MAIADMDPVAGGLARQRQWRERKAEQVARIDLVDSLVDLTQRESVGPALLRMALNLAQRANEAEVEVNTALERKQTAETANILHKMARLEMGESTSNTATLDVADAFAKQRELDARLARLRDEDTQ